MRISNEIVVDFGGSIGVKRWKNISDFHNWMTGIQNEWQWLGGSTGAARSAWSVMQHALNGCIQSSGQAMNYLRQDGGEQQSRAYLSQATNGIASFFSSRPWAFEGSARMVFISALRDEGKIAEAGIIMAHWLGQDIRSEPLDVVTKAFIALDFFERGVKGRFKYDDKALNDLAAAHRAGVSELEKEQERVVTAHSERLKELAETEVTRGSEFSQAQISREKEWGVIIGEINGDLSKLKQTYNEYMSLAAPVDYWEGKRKRHQQWSIFSGLILVISMASSGFFLHSELETIADNASKASVVTVKTTGVVDSKSAVTAQPSQSDSTIATVATSTVEKAAAWKLGSFLLLATLCFWALKILVRIFLSNLHLENDAAERVTMAKTYLALIRDDSLPKGENIGTVLAALFRPTGDGIVKDEGVPPSTLDWFTRLGGK